MLIADPDPWFATRMSMDRVLCCVCNTNSSVFRFASQIHLHPVYHGGACAMEPATFMTSTVPYTIL